MPTTTTRICHASFETIHEDCHEKGIECAACVATQFARDIDGGKINSGDELHALADAYAEQMAVAFNNPAHASRNMMMKIVTAVFMLKTAKNTGIDLVVRTERGEGNPFHKAANATHH